MELLQSVVILILAVDLIAVLILQRRVFNIVQEQSWLIKNNSENISYILSKLTK